MLKLSCLSQVPCYKWSHVTHTMLQEGGGTQGAAPLLMEVRSRLSCRLALMSELEHLKTRFTVSKIEVCSLAPLFLQKNDDAERFTRRSQHTHTHTHTHKTQDAGAVILEFSPAVGKNASRWRCEVRKNSYTISHSLYQMCKCATRTRACGLYFGHA